MALYALLLDINFLSRAEGSSAGASLACFHLKRLSGRAGYQKLAWTAILRVIGIAITKTTRQDKHADILCRLRRHEK